MNRVEVTRPVIGLCHMQVCAVADATDEEILAVANKENASGTTHGWTTVLRNPEQLEALPIKCKEYPERTHYLLSC